MTIANDILNKRIPNFDHYISAGESLDDIDEYGFTPLIETVITKQIEIAKLLLNKGVNVNKADVAGRTALHWAIDNADIPMVKLLLENQADSNAYSSSSITPLVYPILRNQKELKALLYRYDAKVDFALDFIYAKLLGHRFELSGDVDIVNVRGEFIELDYEGFILEFSVAIIHQALNKFLNSFSTRHLRSHLYYFQDIVNGFAVAENLLRYQRQVPFSPSQEEQISQLLDAPLLILPAASRGHAISFIRYQDLWAKIDRGENSKKEGSVNIYRITRQDNFNFNFLRDFLYKKQSRRFFHEVINERLGLIPLTKMPISSQITGNCSWANVQAVVPVAYAMQRMHHEGSISNADAFQLYDTWIEWDKDRALEEIIQRFERAGTRRKASFAAMLGAVLFQACDASKRQDLARAEKILAILTQPNYAYILESYLEFYCIKQLTYKGNNLLKILDDCGINPNVGITPIATGLPPRE
jgi:hypothetical protein